MFFSAQNRAAISISEIPKEFSITETVDVLAKIGMVPITIDFDLLVEQVLGVSKYKSGVRSRKAPAWVDCSSLTKWVYAQYGVWLPRRPVQQHGKGIPVKKEACTALDLVFTSGDHGLYESNPELTIGHVGVVIDAERILHASDPTNGVLVSSFDAFTGDSLLRGVYRIFTEPIYTFHVPSYLDIETSDDIRWKLLQSLSRC